MIWRHYLVASEISFWTTWTASVTLLFLKMVVACDVCLVEASTWGMWGSRILWDSWAHCSPEPQGRAAPIQAYHWAGELSIETNFFQQLNVIVYVFWRNGEEYCMKIIQNCSSSNSYRVRYKMQADLWWHMSTLYFPTLAEVGGCNMGCSSQPTTFCTFLVFKSRYLKGCWTSRWLWTRTALSKQSSIRWFIVWLLPDSSA